jgi:hypothetical protein
MTQRDKLVAHFDRLIAEQRENAVLFSIKENCWRIQ